MNVGDCGPSVEATFSPRSRSNRAAPIRRTLAISRRCELRRPWSETCEGGILMSNLLLLIIVLVLLFGWGGGMAMHAGGNLIHLLLVVAVVVVLFRVITGRR